jgi:hypothetical protein
MCLGTSNTFIRSTSTTGWMIGWTRLTNSFLTLYTGRTTTGLGRCILINTSFLLLLDEDLINFEMDKSIRFFINSYINQSI